MNKQQGILLDIEGTTSSVQFVYEVMFAYARRELENFLAQHWGSAELDLACEYIAKDQKRESFDHLCQIENVHTPETKRELVRNILRSEMDLDRKTTGLKHVQGLVWRTGFASGELKAEVYPDVPPALTAWNQAGYDVRIYSSGSVQAQRLFFGHTIYGDLLPQFRGFYDTTTGPKKEAASYVKIAASFGLPAEQILFVSDIVAELNAAREAGLRTALSIRPGNAAVEAGHGHPEIHSFAELML